MSRNGEARFASTDSKRDVVVTWSEAFQLVRIDFDHGDYVYIDMPTHEAKKLAKYITEVVK